MSAKFQDSYLPPVQLSPTEANGRKPMKQRCPGPRTAAGDGASSNAPELPTGKAFVLQLSRDTGPMLQPFTGRVEHLATGRRVRFATIEDFQQAVIRLLREAQTRDPVGDAERNDQ